MITETHPAPPARREIPLHDELAPLRLAALSAVAAAILALVALVLTVGVVKAVVTGQPGLDLADAAIVTSLWGLAGACWLSRTRAGL